MQNTCFLPTKNVDLLRRKYFAISRLKNHLRVTLYTHTHSYIYISLVLLFSMYRFFFRTNKIHFSLFRLFVRCSFFCCCSGEETGEIGQPLKKNNTHSHKPKNECIYYVKHVWCLRHFVLYFFFLSTLTEIEIKSKIKEMK